jgi:hypothetical protein
MFFSVEIFVTITVVRKAKNPKKLEVQQVGCNLAERHDSKSLRK